MNQRHEHIRKSSLAARQHRSCGIGVVIQALTLACVVIGCTGRAQVTAASAAVDRLTSLRGLLERATEQHATDEQLGGVWLRLADEYQHRYALAEAEDAYGRALSLLRAPTTQLFYARSLEGLGVLYSQTARPVEADSCMRKALAIYQTFGDRRRVARLYELMGTSMLYEARYRDAERDFGEALNDLEAESPIDYAELGSALVGHSYALSFQGRSQAALEDARRARSVVQARFAANSLEIAAVWMVEGVAKWKAGILDEGGKEMSEAMRIVHSRTDLPPALVVHMEVGMMMQYDRYLKESHRKPEAKAIEAEIVQLQSAQPSVCRNCTVNVAALVSSKR